jgi:hypothetical protein
MKAAWPIQSLVELNDISVEKFDLRRNPHRRPGRLADLAFFDH